VQLSAGPCGTVAGRGGGQTGASSVTHHPISVASICVHGLVMNPQPKTDISFAAAHNCYSVGWPPKWQARNCCRRTAGPEGPTAHRSVEAMGFGWVRLGHAHGRPARGLDRPIQWVRGHGDAGDGAPACVVGRSCSSRPAFPVKDRPDRPARGWSNPVSREAAAPASSSSSARYLHEVAGGHGWPKPTGWACPSSRSARRSPGAT